MRIVTRVYRALNPVWAMMPLSGEGARLHGGRFNPKGMAALYTSLDVQTALAEAGQVGRPLQPTTLVSYEVDVTPVFDASDQGELSARAVDAALLAGDDWRVAMRDGGEAPTQSLARALAADAFAGMIAPSFARTAQAGARNLILWRWGPDLPHRLTLNDDDGRLNP